MITIPSYIERTGIVEMPVKHAWNNSDPESLFPEDARLAKRIGAICNRGVLALSAGFTEWIAWRLNKYSADPVLHFEIEAVWAGIIDWRYLGPLVQSSRAPDPDDWRGASRGPVRYAFRGLSQIVALAKRSSYLADDSSCLSNLALLVMPDPEPFKEWRRFAIERLSKLYPYRLKGDVLGPPIPRKALDPNEKFEPEMATALLSDYLETLDYKKNPFLRSPKEMIKDGYKGVPYKL
jgi:hypothetical protein